MNLKRERNSYDNQNNAEQFVSGVSAAIEKYDMFRDDSFSRHEVQDLIKDYGGSFETGVRFGVEICEYNPDTDFDFRTLDEERVVNTDKFTFRG